MSRTRSTGSPKARSLAQSALIALCLAGAGSAAVLSSTAFEPRGASTPGAEQLRTEALERGFGPLPPAPTVRPELVALGRALAFDKVLSGNRDISCMTCHHPSLGTGDGRRLSIGTGGNGLGPDRELGHGLVIGRNSPPLFNLHAVDSLFLDGRVAHLDGDYATPAGAWLTPTMRDVFEFGALSSLALFPVLSRAEMRGFGGNELAALPSGRPDLIWRGLMARLGAIDDYRSMFEAAYPETPFEQMGFAHASNAIAAFIVSEFAFGDTPWDRFLAGDMEALSDEQLSGARTFLDLACSECHSGPALSDGEFHNVALAQFGPGLGDGTGRDDYGRYRVTGDPIDRYAFRTSSLRNVELTAPYGHAGQFADLADFVAHYSLSADALLAFGDELPSELSSTLLGNTAAVLATRDELLDGVEFDESTVDELVDFLGALTDEAARDLGAGVPRTVPSGLAVER